MSQAAANLSLLARHWTLVRGVWGAAGIVLTVTGLCLNPRMAARFVSDDGVLERGTVLTILICEAVLLSLGLLLAAAALGCRRWTPRLAYWIKGLCVLATSIVVLMLLGEVAARLALRNQPLQRHRHYFFHHDNQLGWRHRPGAECLFKNQPVRINAQGLRDDEFVVPKPPGTYRILMLGDSQLFGDGIKAEEGLAKCLERQLSNVQVINAGVIGYGNDQELLYFERDGIQLGSDLTIITLNPYDFRDNVSSSVRSGYRKPRFKVHQGKLTLQGVPVPAPGLLDRLCRRLSDTSLLYRLIQQRMEHRHPDTVIASPAVGNSDDAVTQEIYPQGDALDRASEVTCLILARLAESVRSSRSQALVVFLPYEMNLRPPSPFCETTDQMLARLTACGKTHGFPVLDMRDALQAAPRDGLYTDTMHFSAAGNARLAVYLAGYLRSHHLVPVGQLGSEGVAASTVAALQSSHAP